MQLSLKGTEAVNNVQLLDFRKFRFLLLIRSHGLIDYGNQKNVQYFFSQQEEREQMHLIHNNIRMAIKVPNTNKSWKTTQFLLVWKFQAMARSIMATKNAQKGTIFCSSKRVKRCTWSIIKGTTSMQALITNKILNLALVLCCSSSSSLYSALCFFLAFKP